MLINLRAKVRVILFILILIGLVCSYLAINHNNAKAVSYPNIKIGTYSGDGNSTQDIGLGSGWGTPDMIIAQPAPNSGSAIATTGYIRIAGMSGSKNFASSSSTLSSTAVTNMTNDTFTVGSSLNASGTTYGYVAIRAGGLDSATFDDYFAYGSYSGNSTDNRSICLKNGDTPSGGDCPSGSGEPTWVPNFTAVVTTGLGSVPFLRPGSMTGDLSYPFDATNGGGNLIQNLDPNSNGGEFQVGTSTGVNASGGTYYWFALRNLDNYILSGKYTGNNTDNRNITALNDSGGTPYSNMFSPNFALVKIQANTYSGVTRYYDASSGNQSGDISSVFTGNSAANLIQAFNSSPAGFQVGTDTKVNFNGGTLHTLLLANYTGSGGAVNSTFTQGAYRWFGNTDTTDVGSALANQDMSITAPSQGNPFRLRMAITIGTEDLAQSAQAFKLQAAQKSGTCDTSFTGETYADVSDSSGEIRFYNNATPSDGANATANANDPLVSGHTKSIQTYEESNNFTNSTSLITNGYDGVWDFALVDNSAPNDTSYCFRVVKGDGSTLNTYSVIPELVTSPSGSITITAPTDYKTYQRNGSNQADIPITGTYTGTPTSIEARFNGGSWATIVASPTGGSYSGTLSAQSAGQGNLEVRFSNATTITAAKSYIGIGDVYAITGDSNASGAGASLNSYSHGSLKATMYKNSNVWAELADPTDSSTGQSSSRATYDSVVTDSSTDKGSIWPLLATKIMASQNVPVAIIPAARWGSFYAGTPALINSSNWRRWDSDPTNTLNLYGDLRTKVSNAGSGLKGIIFFEGANDIALVSDAQRANWKSQVNEIVTDFNTDMGVKTMLMLVGDCEPIDFSCDTVEAFDNHREVIKEIWSENANAVPGAVLYDINKASPDGDGIHYNSVANQQIIANRIWKALEKQYYNGSADGRGPQMSTVQHNAGKTQVYVTFTDDTLPITPVSGINGFRVKDNGTPVSLSSVARTASNKVTIDLASAASGTITVSYCEYRDCAGTSNVIKDSSSDALPAEMFIDQASSLLSDTNGPTGSISIEGGATTATSRNVTLTLSATDDIDPPGSLQMMISNDAGFSGASWEAYATSKAWTLTSGPGAKTVYAKFRDSSLNESVDYSDGITLNDVNGPTGSITIDSGAATTNSLGVTLTLSANDDIDDVGNLQMMISNASNFSGASWEAYATSKAWTLTNGAGNKTVYVKFKDTTSNESISYSDAISLVDVSAPSGSISINSGAATVNTLSVTLTLSATDDIENSTGIEMQISNDAGFSGASWEAYATSKAWTLTSGPGAKTVYARFRDASTNVSGGYSDDITVVDGNAPSGSISINGNAATANNLNATLTLSATDDIDSSGNLQMMISNDAGFSGAAWEAYTTSKAWTLTSGTGAKTVYARFRDTTSNTSGDLNDSITVIDNIAPSGSITINSGGATTASPNVTLTFSASDDFDGTNNIQMKISDNNSFAGASYEAYSATKSWTLPGSFGSKTVYVKFMDLSSNESTSYSATINYTDGSGGNNNNNNSGGGSNNDGSQTVANSPVSSDQSQATTTAQEPVENIVLNDYPEFFGEEGVLKGVVVGQKIYFKLSDNAPSDQHSIYVQSIEDGRVVLVIASEPIVLTLAVGQVEQVDVDSDNQKDISITLESIDDGRAFLRTRRLSMVTADDGAAKDERNKAEKKEEVGASKFTWPLIIVAGAGLLTVALLIRKLLFRNKKLF